MTLKRISTLMFMIIIVLSGCSSNDVTTTKDHKSQKVKETKDEVQKGDFVYRLVTQEAIYKNSDSVNLYAELEYVGEKDQITISHGSTPLYFPITEKTRGYKIPYNTTDPLRKTTLEKGSPIRERFGGTGAYGSDDEESYKNFMKSMMNNQFPEGFYVVNGFSDLYVKGKNGKKKEYKMKAQVEFKVE